MHAAINFLDQPNGNYSVRMDLPKDCNVAMIITGLNETINYLQNDHFNLYGALIPGGITKHRLELSFEITPPTAHYVFTCIKCRTQPVDVDNDQEICDNCLNEPAPTY